ncbi:MAG: 3-phosphoshikimate 1-carboxyvinyltransferase [Terriglobales bacterium]
MSATVAQLLRPARQLSGAVRPPGDKSISHRSAILAALAEGRSTIANFSTGADCRSTLACLQALGAGIETGADGEIAITGHGRAGLKPPAAELDAGNSGSTIRMLSGILAAQPFSSRISGDASLRRRPMRRVIEPLEQMGARITAADGFPPLAFAPSPGLRGIAYRPPVASAQVKTAVLLAALFAAGETVVTEPLPTRDHTEIALRQFGAAVRSLGGNRIALQPSPAEWAPQTLRVPGDPSSAAFFLCAAALLPESDLLVDEISLNPRRAALLDLLRRMGARVSMVNLEARHGELAGSLVVRGPEHGRLQGAEIAGAETVALIDEIPILAVLATAADGGIRFRDAAELRVKESDRLAAIAANLRRMGAVCEERPDGLDVPGPQPLHGAALESYGDHRIAMAFSIAALAARGESAIQDPGCVAISYPEFFATLASLSGQ